MTEAMNGVQMMQETETVDKTLIERLILEHSDRLELEINQKARADAWKFYFRVRVDHVVRPFAVCKACYRVLHCDSRSGTASLLRHPCNPLSERSPVNRAVKLNAKLNLPNDKNLFKDSQDVRQRLGIKTSCSSPTSTGSPPTASQPPFSASVTVPSPNNNNNNVGRKRKAGPTPVFPLDLRLLHLPQVMAAVAANPLAAINLANATSALLSDPQHFHQFQQQQLQLEHLLREQQLHERDIKRNKEDDCQERTASPGESSTSPSWNWNMVKHERIENSDEEAKDFSFSKLKSQLEQEQPLNKESVQNLVSSNSPRVMLADKDSAGAHYISDVWNRFQVVYVDGVLRPFAACKICHKVVTYTKYSGTGGLLRHRCCPGTIGSPKADRIVSEEIFDPKYTYSPKTRDNYSPKPKDSYSPKLRASHSPRPRDHEGKNFAQSPTMSGLASALLKYMCQDLVSSSTLDTPAFHQMVHNVMNLGAAHGSFRSGQSLPSSRELLDNYLQPLVSDSKDSLARNLQDEKYLCISLHHKQQGEAEMIAAALHCINEKFELQNHSIGTRNLYKGESKDEAIKELLKDFFKNILPPVPIVDKHVTVVADRGDLSNIGSSNVECLWHAMESILDGLGELHSYKMVCEELRSIITFLTDSSLGMKPNGVHINEITRWEVFLHGLAFILQEYTAIQCLLERNSKPMSDKGTIIELHEFFIGIKRCLHTVRDHKRPTLNQAVLCRAKLHHLCTAPATSSVTQQIKDFLLTKFENLTLAPQHLVASFLDPRCKSLKVLNDSEKHEVRRSVLEMMKAVSVSEENSGALNLKTRRTGSPLHPFSEYMDNPAGSDVSISDSEEVMAYVNSKVQLDDDDILAWWRGPSSSGLPTLRRLARKILAVPATCTFACQMSSHAAAASEHMGIQDPNLLNGVLHMKYNS